MTTAWCTRGGRISERLRSPFPPWHAGSRTPSCCYHRRQMMAVWHTQSGRIAWCDLEASPLWHAASRISPSCPPSHTGPRVTPGVAASLGLNINHALLSMLGAEFRFLAAHNPIRRLRVTPLLVAARPLSLVIKYIGHTIQIHTTKQLC